MLKQLRIQNFKGWKDTDTIRMAPITLFFGANSSGKSSSYQEFPKHDDLNDFDKSDRKFVAVANACTGKPPILQATDSKWWGWKDALNDVGITVHFLCPEYAKTKYAEKIGA